MATSRTGTARYKRNSARALHSAQVAGVTHCPRCDVPLDYKNRTRPNGASVDHITPHSQGGTDDLTNLTIICLKCNTSIGNKQPRKPRRQTITPTTMATTTGRRPGMPPTHQGE